MQVYMLRQISATATHVLMSRQEVRSTPIFWSLPELQSVAKSNNITVAVDWTSVQLKSFSVACSIVFEPLDQQAIDKAVDTASCEDSGKGSSDDIYSFPPIYTSENKPSPKMTPVPTPYDSEQTFVYGFSPTGSTGSSAIVVPIASTATVSESHILPTLISSIWYDFFSQRDVTYSYATLTVPVTPVPVSVSLNITL